MAWAQILKLEDIFEYIYWTRECLEHLLNLAHSHRCLDSWSQRVIACFQAFILLESIWAHKFAWEASGELSQKTKSKFWLFDGVFCFQNRMLVIIPIYFFGKILNCFCPRLVECSERFGVWSIQTLYMAPAFFPSQNATVTWSPFTLHTYSRILMIVIHSPKE